MTQNLIYGALAVSTGMIVACIADLFMGLPFGGNLTADIVFLLASAAVAWMGIDCLRSLRRKKK